MKQTCKFDKFKDFKCAAPSLSIDLSVALKDKVIPSTGTELEYNDIESSSSVGVRVRDEFEAIEAQRYVTKLGADADKASNAVKAAEATSTQITEGAN